jgi:hypothetical protein
MRQVLRKQTCAAAQGRKDNHQIRVLGYKSGGTETIQVLVNI